MSPEELPILVIGDHVHPHDHVTIATYRWEDTGEPLIRVSIGVTARGSFSNHRHASISRTEFASLVQDVNALSDKESATIQLREAKDLFGITLRVVGNECEASGWIVDERSGRQTFWLDGFNRGHIVGTLPSLKRILDWFPVASG